MADSTMSISTDARLVERRTAPPLGAPYLSQSSDAELFAALRQSLAAGRNTSDSIFHEVAEAARILTGASGIALAVCTDGVVVCRARSGEIAPAIGAKLDVESGISAQSFRTSRVLRCDDTRTDDRVDPQVCSYLGIFSIAVVPLRGAEGACGILEAFSSRPYAFSGTQVSILDRLAEIAESAYRRELGQENRSVPTPKRRFRLRELITNSTDEALPSELFDEPSGNSRRHYWVVGAFITLLLLTSAVIWISWYDPDDEIVSSNPVSQSNAAVDDTATRPISLGVSLKPAVTGDKGHFDALPSRRSKRATTETAHEVIRSASIASPEAPLENSSLGAKRNATATVEEAPDVAALVTDGKTLAIPTSTLEGLPNLETPMSQGLTEAVLVYKLQPVYPLAARAARTEGSVILEATVTEEGTTRNIRVISGPPELVDAATEAVRHWRYQPALLNGNPTAVEKQIQVIFKAP